MNRKQRRAYPVVLLTLATVVCGVGADDTQTLLTGKVVDADTGKIVAARLYIHNEKGKWFHADTASSNGKAIDYHVDRGDSVEIHTTLSAHPFQTGLLPGRYTITVERGKEYLSLSRQIELKSKPLDVTLKIQRFVDMANRGWFSGETHIHRKLSEVPLLVQAEDLNVALPLTYWVTDSEQTPATSNKITGSAPTPKLINVDPSHVIWPVNTEYEIFTVRGKRHTLGAVFVLNHREPLSIKTPPVRSVAEFAREQGAVLDLDKHNWPWSMTIVPLMDVRLFELTNNHVWRTQFLFKSWYPEYVADYMGVELDGEGGFTERGWVEFGLQTYYTLLNCGFNVKPTGGTATGVHPVPFGFGRVYAHLPGEFSYEEWMKQLEAGKTFVTTGPLLVTKFNSKHSGETIQVEKPGDFKGIAEGTIDSEHPLSSIEVIVNGRVAATLDPQPEKTKVGAYRTRFKANFNIDGSSWVVVRCFETLLNSKRFRFAHTAPVFYHVDGRPLRPHKVEVDYLIGRVEDEIERHQNSLDKSSLSEHRQALDVYRQLRKTARD